MDSGATKREQTAATEARDLLVFAEGFDEAGHTGIARRSRVVARELLWALDALQAERSARVAIQKQRDECLQILANHAGEALAKTA